MKEQQITFETAKLAWGKGFRLGTNPHYGEGGKKVYHGFSGGDISDHGGAKVSCVPQSVLQKWMRDRLRTVVEAYATVEDNKLRYVWAYTDYRSNPNLAECKTVYSQDCKVSYEEALEEGMALALKLIKT